MCPKWETNQAPRVWHITLLIIVPLVNQISRVKNSMHSTVPTVICFLILLEA